MTSTAVECKKTDKIDFVKPLFKHIQTEYGKDLAAQHNQAIVDITQFREDLRLNSEKTDSAREKHLHYLKLLDFLAKHFPIQEKGVKINFTWQDFVGKKRGASYQLLFEKINIQFNIAAIESQIACLHNRSTEDGVKLACKYFLMAAGTLGNLLEIVKEQPHLILLCDLSVDYIQMIILLMIGQAQECCFEKAERGGMKAPILCKIAAQVVDYYEKANNILKVLVDKSPVPPYWINFLHFKIVIYQGISNYQMSMIALAEDKYGEQVAWLTRAVHYMNDQNLQKKLKTAPATIQQQFHERAEVIFAAYRTAENDNSKVYHEVVPRQLPSIPLKSIVAPIPFSYSPLPSDQDPFKLLIPSAVSRFLSSFNENKLKTVTHLVDLSAENDQIARASLQTMNLPGALQALDTPTGIPPETRNMITKFRQLGGLNKSANDSAIIKKLKEDAGSIIAACTSLLNNEETEDSNFRSQYKHLWVIPPSHSVNSSLRQEISQSQANLAHASKSDDLVAQKLNDTLRILHSLGGSDQEILELIPSSQSVGVEVRNNADNIKIALAELDGLISARVSILAQVTALNEGAEISSLLIQAPNPEFIVQQELSKFQPLQAALEANCQSQSSVLDKIADLNQIFVRSLQASSSSASRDAAIRKISDSVKLFAEILGNFAEGTNFYQQFLKLLNALKSKCDSFVNERATKKSECLTRIKQMEAQQQTVSMIGNQIPQKYLYPQGQQMPQQQQQQPPYYPQNPQMGSQYSYYVPDPSQGSYYPQNNNY